MKILSFVIDIFRKFPRLLITNTVLLVFSAVLEASVFVAVGPLVDLFLHHDLKNISHFTERLGGFFAYFNYPLSLYSYLLFFIVFILISSTFSILSRYSIEKVRFSILSNLVAGSFKNCFDARWYFFTSSKKGALLNTFMKEIYTIGSAFDDISYSFSLSLQIIFFLVIPFYVSWRVTLLSCLAMVIFAWPFLFIGKFSYRLKNEGLAASNQIAEVIMESFSLAKVILGFGQQDKSYKDLTSVFDKSSKACIKYETIKTVIPTLYQPCAVLVLAISLLATSRFQIATSEMVVIFLTLLKAIASISRLAVHQNALNASLPSYEQFKKLNARALELKQFSGVKIFEGFRSEMTIRNMSFAYPEHEPVLVNINMKFPKGNMIAMVGESGAGKSTLIDLIMGFHEPSSGRIAFDGVDLKEFNMNSYRKKIGYVPQDCVLFNTTIKNNLLWVKETATDEEIVEACKQANAYEFIQKLPDGFGAVVGDRGVRLSGGQNQRMALARAILRNPELLILDEATSALDTHSERLIQEAIENIAKKTNVIVIAHRLSTIVNADYIYVLQNGAIVEEGDYHHLVASEGCFSRMIHLQTLEKSVL